MRWWTQRPATQCIILKIIGFKKWLNMSLHNLWMTQTVTNKQKACKKFEKLRQICHTCLWKLINYDEAVLVYLCSLTLCFISKFVSPANDFKLYRPSEYRGSPIYTKITNRVSTTTVFDLCTCKWGIFVFSPTNMN